MTTWRFARMCSSVVPRFKTTNGERQKKVAAETAPARITRENPSRPRRKSWLTTNAGARKIR
jgi:hypothetical protein